MDFLLFDIRDLEEYDLNERKRIILTSRLSLLAIILLVCYIPLLSILKLWFLLCVTLFTISTSVLTIVLNKRKYHTIAKLLLAIEPVLTIFIVSLAYKNSSHLYNIVIIGIPFLIFNYKTQKTYIFLSAALNIISIATCQLVTYYPAYNPIPTVTETIQWLEYSNWIASCGLSVALITVIASTNSQTEQHLIQVKEKIELQNQELAAREEELRQNLEELQATQEALMREKQLAIDLKERFELAIEGTNDGIWDWDLKTNYVFYSPKWKAILGYTDEELKNDLNTFSQLVHPEYSDWVSAEIQSYLSGKTSKYEVEIPMRTKEGDYKWILGKGIAIRDENGVPYRMIGSLSDITERKKAQEKIELQNQELIAREEELRQNLEELQATQEALMREKQLAIDLKERFELAIEGTNDGIWDWNLKTNYVFYSPKWKSMLGYTDEELKNELDTFSSLIHPEHIERVFAEVQSYLEGKISKYEVEIPMRTKTGDYKWILSKGTALRDSQGIPYRMLGSHADITERKKAQEKIELQNQELISREEELKQNLEELQATQEQMRLAQAEAERNAMNANKIFEAAPVALFISKVSNLTIIQANQSMAKLFKIPVFEILGRQIASFYASEEQANADFAELMQNGKFEDKEVDLRLDDGSVITALASAQVMTLSNEKVVVAGFNEITALKKAQAELSDLAQNLAKKVEEQTEEIKQSFSQLIQSEKMAVLGQLVAGVAHEINTPLGAINAAASNISDNFKQIITLFIKNLAIIEQQPQVFQEICDFLAQPKNALSSREERQLRKKLAVLLEEQNVQNADEIATELASVAFHIDLQPFTSLFQIPNPEIHELLFAIGKTSINIGSINTAVMKTQKIVSSLKAYTYRKNYEHKEPTNINDTIDNILILYHNQTKHGVEVITDYQELPTIKVFGDEIGQVWNNIIVNALQAMKYQGKLQIQTFQENGNIVVKITDNGPGIPKEIQDKIFEPFFTTKPQGEGTGLGLDICKKIVEEKHHGKIEVFSEPGCTCFTVTLPIEQN